MKNIKIKLLFNGNGVMMIDQSEQKLAKLPFEPMWNIMVHENLVGAISDICEPTGGDFQTDEEGNLLSQLASAIIVRGREDNKIFRNKSKYTIAITKLGGMQIGSIGIGISDAVEAKMATQQGWGMREYMLQNPTQQTKILKSVFGKMRELGITMADIKNSG